MRIPKTYLRSIMNQSRLTGLAHLNINTDTPIISNEVIDKLETQKRKLDFIL